MSVDDTWTESRCAELLALERLLSDVSMINAGSNVLQRLARCIEAAEALRASDHRTGRSNFMLFLNKQATNAIVAARNNSAPPQAEPSGSGVDNEETQ